MDRGLREKAVGVTVTVAAVVLAAFMPWGSYYASLDDPLASSGLGAMLQAFRVRVAVNGWSGVTEVAGVTVPYWLTAALAGAAMLLVWLRALGVWHPSRLLAPALALAGLGEIAKVIYDFSQSKGASIGIGPFVAAAAMVGLLITLVRPFRSPATGVVVTSS